MKTMFLSAAFLLLTLTANCQDESTKDIFTSGNTGWRVGGGIYTGYCALTDSLGHYFNNNIPIGLSVHFQYSIIVMDLRASVSFSNLAHNIKYGDGIWEKYSWVSSHFYDVSLGLNIGDPKTVSVTPFASIGSSDFLRTQIFKSDDYEPGDGELGDSFTFSYGINMDIHLSTQHSEGEIKSDATLASYMRLGYTYSSPHFEKHDNGFKGNMHFLTLGIVLLFQGF